MPEPLVFEPHSDGTADSPGAPERVAQVVELRAPAAQRAEGAEERAERAEGGAPGMPPAEAHPVGSTEIPEGNLAEGPEERAEGAEGAERAEGAKPAEQESADLVGVDFAGEWAEWLPAHLLAGMRVIGVLDFRLRGQLRRGVLCKLKDVNEHRVVTDQGILREHPSQADIDHFLMKVRRGQGGRGRGQGRPAKDGVCYPKRVEFLVAAELIADLLKHDLEDEGLSGCVRKLLAKADLDATCSVEDPGPPMDPKKSKLYLDPDSLAKLQQIGEGSNARGLRRLWASVRQPVKALITKDQPVNYGFADD